MAEATSTDKMWSTRVRRAAVAGMLVRLLLGAALVLRPLLDVQLDLWQKAEPHSAGT